MKYWCASLILLLLPLTGCNSTGTVGGTEWTVVDVLSSHNPDIVDMDISFSADGMVTTTTTNSDGTLETTRYAYSVHDALISVSRPEGNFSALHRIEGDQMLLTAETFQARLQRLD